MEKAAGDETAEDKREWMTAGEAGARLRLGQSYVLRVARERGLECRPGHSHRQTQFLRRDIESWANFRDLRRQWLAKYRKSRGDKRWTEKIDEETARRLFVGAKEAAQMLGVAPTTLSNLIRRGRMVCYQGIPGRRGSRLWFSRRAVLQLRDDEARLKGQANYRKGKGKSAEVKPEKAQATRAVRGGVPKGWLTAREAAERLGVSSRRVREMRAAGKIRGEQIWRKYKPLKFWYFPDYEVERVIEWRRLEKEAAGPPLLAVPLPDSACGPPERLGGADLSGAACCAPAMLTRKGVSPCGRRTMEYEDLAVAGPEPQWACDDVDLRRAFFASGP